MFVKSILSDRPLPHPKRWVSIHSKRAQEAMAKDIVGYSDQEKLGACQSFVLLGSVPQAAKVTGISESLLRKWKTEKWWKDLEAELRQTETLVLTSKLKNQVEKAMALVEDRLENGDYFYHPKTGEFVRKPVALKDAHQVVKDFIDRRHKLITHEENKMQQQDIHAHLALLAKAFEEFAIKDTKQNKKDLPPAEEIIDV